MMLKRIGPLSCGKVMGVLYAAMGLVVGLIFTVASFFVSILGVAASDSPEPLFAMLFGVGAVFVLPIFYGIMGFLGGLIGAALYNVVAGTVGGIEVELG